MLAGNGKKDCRFCVKEHPVLSPEEELNENDRTQGIAQHLWVSEPSTWTPDISRWIRPR